MKRSGKARTGALVSVLILATGGLSLLSAGVGHAAAAGPACPAVGQDTDCGIVITVDKNGAHVSSTGQPPFDGIEDTMVGVVNNDTIPIKALGLSSDAPIFAFDGDGLTAFGVPGNSYDSTGYGGPNAFFQHISADQTGGQVRFVTAIPPGGTGFFSLEESVANAVSCRDLVKNSVKHQVHGGTVTATFTPNKGYTLTQAAKLCGFKDFDWVQTSTHRDDPNFFFARNLNGGFDPHVNGPVRLSSNRTPYNDPPPGGGYTYTAQPDNSYPFYYDPNTELAGQKSADDKTLNFMDAPSDPCMPGGHAVNTPACLNSSQPAGAYEGWRTQIAGVDRHGKRVNLGVGFSWKTNYTGTSGGIFQNKSSSPADDNGTGGVTITGETDDTAYEFDGIQVTDLNDGPVGAAQSALADSTPSAVANGSATTLSAQLSDVDANPVGGESVTLTLGTGAGAQSCDGTTDSTGTAACTVTVAQPLGPTPFSASFAGDNLYQASTTTDSIVVFEYTAGGAFTAGDNSGGTLSPGNRVTFWGANWSSDNQLSGGPAPDAFKGFENGATVPTLGTTWSTRPGNSAGPPATLPGYTAIVVTSKVTKNGPTISGDTTHIVVVQTDPGYQPDPGHPASGTIVAMLT